MPTPAQYRTWNTIARGATTADLIAGKEEFSAELASRAAELDRKISSRSLRAAAMPPTENRLPLPPSLPREETEVKTRPTDRPPARNKK